MTFIQPEDTGQAAKQADRPNATGHHAATLAGESEGNMSCFYVHAL